MFPARVIWKVFYNFYNQLLQTLLSISENEYIRFFQPLIWPRHSTKLKALVVASFVCVGVGLVVNLYVPIYTQIIVDALASTRTDKDEAGRVSLFKILSIFIVLKLLQGVGTLSLLNVIQSLLWIKLEHNAQRNVQVQFFSHLHKMGIDWQLSQKTGDILGTLERGSAGVATILERLLYSILPTLANICIAVVYLSHRFSGAIGMTVLFQTICYVWTTLKFTEWRTRYQKCLNRAEDEQKQQAVESLLNFETVKLFGNEEYETLKYAGKVDAFHAQEFAVMASLNLLQLLQLTIVNLGLFIGSLIAISLIVNDKTMAVGDYVLFTSYMAQLILPLNYLGTHYRNLRVGLTNVDQMMRIFREKPNPWDNKALMTTKTDDIIISQGEIEFKEVYFSYSKSKQVLQGVSFTIPAKKTIALVGESGAGKSTIVRLLAKLYDPSSGNILIDGISLRGCNPSSLRKFIGVVPQDTILFHDTIRNNIKYGKLDATDAEILLAAQSAQIHNKIMTLPQKYDTMVGERGLKLSGGERQRIAISKMFLKNPTIILLDEATSSLDVKTEVDIMESFAKLCKSRTSLIVTHRLQSVVHADAILVLKNGVIVESGTHSELLRLQKEYYSMWTRQKRTSEIKDE